MGALVPFPKRRVERDIPPARVPSEGPAKIIILPVVQFVRVDTVPRATPSHGAAAPETL